jgi:hypothetical protein
MCRNGLLPEIGFGEDGHSTRTFPMLPIAKEMYGAGKLRKARRDYRIERLSGTPGF